MSSRLRSRSQLSTRPRSTNGGRSSRRPASGRRTKSGNCYLPYYKQRTTMNLPRRRFLHLAAGAVALPALSRSAGAQAYPTRPVRILVSSPPGGTADFLARVMGQWLSERLGQPSVIENRSGAANNVAAETVANAIAGRLHTPPCQSGERIERNALRQAQLQFHP